VSDPSLRGIEATHPDDDTDHYQAAVAKPDRMVWTSASEHDLPGAIAVGGKPYEVRVFEPCDDAYWDKLLGAIEYGDPTVWVRSGRRADERRETLLHEVLHAVDKAAGTNAGEIVVNAWAPILLDALRDNPALIALLLADDR
jgi:hypothetical protein